MANALAALLETSKVKVRTIAARVRWPIVRAAESATFAAILWAILLILLGVLLWASPPPWLSKIPAVVNGLLQVPGIVVGAAERDPTLAIILTIVRHPLFALVPVLVLAYLWVKDGRAAAAWARESVAQKPSQLTAADRIHQFSHRLGSVVVLLLLIFPGIPVLIGVTVEKVDALGMAVILLVILTFAYLAIRLVGWVIAALFE